MSTKKVTRHQIGEVIYTAEELATRIAQLGASITADYASRVSEESPLVLIGVLKGVIPFFADLMRAIDLPLEIYFLDIARYASATRESVQMELPAKMIGKITSKHILFVEDVINSGLTLNHLMRILYLAEPETLEVCVMFDKQAQRIIDIDLKYIGFSLDDEFVVGYGLDKHELYRNLPYVAVLKR